MLPESMQHMLTGLDGVYLDCSFGAGGHTRAILSRVSERARVYAIDRDPRAVREAKVQDERLTLEQCAWSALGDFARRHNLLGKISGVLLDIGLSSMQLDDAERGFSFQRNGPLDMRMNPEEGEPASRWINRVSVNELRLVLRDYGEEPRAMKVARAIVSARSKAPIQSTAQLAQIATEHAAYSTHRHPATRLFQAVRMHVNREPEELHSALKSVLSLLCAGGRMVVISFHSIEDRLVKRFIRAHASVQQAPDPSKSSAAEQAAPLLPVGKLLRPSVSEVQANPRARSARMRVAMRTASTENAYA
jgi:16S rRNA (cytosine1402-N4)-methyltransferase